MPDYITDTGPLIGWINRRDQWHEWSVGVLDGLEPPLLTCEAVIAEAAWQLTPSAEALDRLYGLVEAGALRIVDLLPEHMPHIRAGRLAVARGRCGDRPSSWQPVGETRD